MTITRSRRWTQPWTSAWCCAHGLKLLVSKLPHLRAVYVCICQHVEVESIERRWPLPLVPIAWIRPATNTKLCMKTSSGTVVEYHTQLAKLETHMHMSLQLFLLNVGRVPTGRGTSLHYCTGIPPCDTQWCTPSKYFACTCSFWIFLFSALQCTCHDPRHKPVHSLEVATEN